VIGRIPGPPVRNSLNGLFSLPGGAFRVCVNKPVTSATLDYMRMRAGVSRQKPPWEPCMRRLVAKFLSDESGATAIEYALIAAGISVAVILTVVQGIGTSLNTRFGSISSSLK
jgi:pilus assembly protein Flp/PilA